MKKNRLIIEKIKENKFAILSFFVCVVFMFSISFAYYGMVENWVSLHNGITIVLDAGHGGRDGGSIGVNGSIEKDLNLEYTLALRDKLVKAGYKVVLTRKNDEGLYSPLAKNKKQSEMKERLRVIKQANPNLVISIHMNSFTDKSAYGAMTYYRKDDESGKNVADLIQNSLSTYCGARFKSGKIGDYYVLNSNYYSAVLIECGFISNPEEERKLKTPEYRKKIVDAIYSGILLYFGNNSNV